MDVKEAWVLIKDVLAGAAGDDFEELESLADAVKVMEKAWIEIYCMVHERLQDFCLALADQVEIRAAIVSIMPESFPDSLDEIYVEDSVTVKSIVYSYLWTLLDLNGLEEQIRELYYERR